MDLAAIHQGLEDLLNQIPGVRCFGSIPDTVPVGTPDVVVVVPSDPYVEYAPTGFPQKHDVYMTLRIIPQPNSTRTVYQSLYELLSTGSDQPRSIVYKLQSTPFGRSANGTACQAWALRVRPIVTQVNGEDMVGMDMDLQIMGSG